MIKKVRTGVLGVGRIGRLHAENIIFNLNNIAEIVSVSDTNYDSAKEWAKSNSIHEVYRDYRDVVNDPEIDAILICTSTETHAQISIEAARAGKHIFCEKPIDFDLNRINRVLEAVNEAGVKFQVGFNRRFDHNFSCLKKTVTEGKIGKPHIIKITSRDPAPPSIDYINTSGGMFLDMTIHDFDMARFLAESEIKEVYVSADVMIDPAIGHAGDVDTAVTVLKFENGVIGVIDNSRKASYGYDQRVEVFGSKGCAIADNDTTNKVTLSINEGVISDKPKYFFLERYKDSFITELGEFFNCIINDKKPSVTGIDGLKSVVVGLAAKESYRIGKPVTIINA